MLERGVLAVLLSYERVLPLLGFACALAPLPGRKMVLATALAVLGLWLGFVGREWLIALAVSGPTTWVRLSLPGPIACLAAGLVLAAPERAQFWLLPAAAVVIGAMLAVALKLVDPSFHDPNFLRGALAAAVWLVAAIALIGRRQAPSWLAIAVRIFGSWLIAIGLMLGAAIMIPRSAPAPPLAEPARPGDPVVPGARTRPGNDAPSPVPAAPPGFDPPRQP